MPMQVLRGQVAIVGQDTAGRNHLIEGARQDIAHALANGSNIYGNIHFEVAENGVQVANAVSWFSDGSGEPIEQIDATFVVEAATMEEAANRVNQFAISNQNGLFGMAVGQALINSGPVGII
jgi:hypothetical protein